MVSGFAPVQDRGGQADGRRRVLGLRFKDKVEVAHLGELGEHRGAVGPAGDDHDVPAGKRDQPFVGGADQRGAGPGEVVEKFGGCGTRERPQSGSDSTCRNHTVESSQEFSVHPTNGS